MNSEEIVFKGLKVLPLPSFYILTASCFSFLNWKYFTVEIIDIFILTEILQFSNIPTIVVLESISHYDTSLFTDSTA